MKKFICLLAAAGCLTACIKDDSTSSSVEMPAVSIAPDDSIVFSVGAESVYEPTITWDGTDPADYDYLWTLNGREELSHEQVLRHVFMEVGEAYLTFQMTDRKTKVVFGRDFKMTVSTPFFLGWLILSENPSDKASMLSFVHMQTFESYPDIYGTYYPNEPLGKEPFRLEWHGISKTDQILVMQRGGEGCVELNGNNFCKASLTENEFIGERYPEQAGGFEPVAVAYTHRGPELLLASDGKIYDRVTAAPTSSSAQFQSAFYSTTPYLHVAGDTRFTRFTSPGMQSNFQLMFDDQNKRWLAYYLTTTIPYNIPQFDKGTGWKADAFDFCTGMSSDVESVYAETYNEGSNKCSLFNVFRQGSNYYTATAELTLATSNHHITVTNADQRSFMSTVDDKSCFCLMRGSGTQYANDPHLFFNVGKKVYFYHWDTDAVYLYKDFDAAKNAPAGDLVCMMQNGNATQMAFAFSDGHFFVCDAAKATLTAIRQNNIDPTGENEIELIHIDNIPGVVKHAVFKYGKAANYTGAKIAY